MKILVPVKRAMTGATASCIYVPPPFAADSILEAIDVEMEAAGIRVSPSPSLLGKTLVEVLKG